MLTPRKVLDDYFLETRCQLLEIAATLDRLGCADQAAASNAASAGDAAPDDPRRALLKAMLRVLVEDNGANQRAQRLLELHSEP
ncbi:MAG: hypothetical protein JJU36_08490 [Phycisphaeraceae bacterium]|nr:hypothetical protein [Phycisphaeraceae bacterium]